MFKNVVITSNSTTVNLFKKPRNLIAKMNLIITNNFVTNQLAEIH